MHGSGPYDELRRMMFFNGIHMLDLGRYLAGDVQSVFAYALHEKPGVQAIAASFHFASGAGGPAQHELGSLVDGLL